MYKTKTRQNLEDWCANEEIGYEGFSKDQLEQLLAAGRSVCFITFTEGDDCGTGFHFGNGWVMTNFHVVHNDTSKTIEISKAKFAFPAREAEIQPLHRSAICSDLIAHADSLTSPVKDLVLIHVPELIEVQGLYDQGFQKPKVGDRICVVHYGGNSNDQKFSFGKITKFDFKDKTCQNFYIESDAWCPDGCSGSPLLWFDKTKGKFCVIGVTDAGTDDLGDALVYTGNHWIQSTLKSASCVCSGIVDKINIFTNISETMPLIAESAVKMRKELLKQLRKLNDTLTADKLLVFLRVDVKVNDEHILQREHLSKITILVNRIDCSKPKAILRLDSKSMQ